MARSSFALALLALLAPLATPFRVKQKVKKTGEKKAEKKNELENQVGGVDMLYSYGAPGSASPGFTNPNDPKGCFPGLRAWTGRKYLGLTGTCDQVPMLTAPLGYRHPMMTHSDFDVRDDYMVRKTECNAESPDKPWYRVGDMILHMRTWYTSVAETVSDEYGNLTDLATFGSYFGDLEYIKLRTEALGWRYVSMASHPGQIIDGGKQQVHLVQHPDTLECLMTFQGSHSAQDWVSNFAVAKSHFCGFVDEDESCSVLPSLGMCAVKRAGSSFVHMGFRDHLRRMVRSIDFQTNIRPHLSGCAKLNVAGHSLGGAMSELFTACSARAPQRLQYGYEEDYKYISYFKGAPRQLWL